MKIYKLTLLFLISTPFILQAQHGAFKIRNDAAIQIGYNNYKYLTFGVGGTTPNNGKFAIEYFDNGLNFWRPWPNWNSGNYFFYIGNDGLTGIGMKAHHTEHSSGGLHSLVLQVKGRACSKNWYTWSDEKLKLNISDLVKGTEVLMKLKPKSYNYRTDFDFNGNNAPTTDLDYVKNMTLKEERERLNNSSEALGSKDFGFLAGDFKKVLPNLVTTVSDIEVDAINVNGLIPILVKAFQEQQHQIEYLKSELENVKTIDNLSKLPENLGIIAYLYQNEPNPFNERTVILIKLILNFSLQN